MSTLSLLGTAFGLSFLSGIRLYAVVFLVGLAVRLDWFSLPPELAGLEILSHTAILIIAGALLLIEFIADKIPWVDSIWDSIHTFIRPVGAMLIGTAAFSQYGAVPEIALGLICGGIGLSSHSAKAGARLVVNQSPEPLSNIATSFIEDAFVLFGTWLFITHPVIGFSIVIILLAIISIILPRLFRLLNMELMALLGIVRGLGMDADQLDRPAPLNALPDHYQRAILAHHIATDDALFLECFAGKGVPGGRYHAGLFIARPNSAFFLRRKWFRLKKYDLKIESPYEVSFHKGLLLSQLRINTAKKSMTFFATREFRSILEKAALILRQK